MIKSVQNILTLGCFDATLFPRRFNNENRHSATRFVTPAQRHSCADTAILAGRQEVYEQTRAVAATSISYGAQSILALG
jgi:hypothetical protein